MNGPAFDFTHDPLAAAAVDVLVVPATQDGDAVRVGPGADELAAALGIDLRDELEALAFDGGKGATARIATRGGAAAPAVVVVGLGAPDDIDAETLRLAAAAVANSVTSAATIATTLAAAGPWADAAVAVQAVVEGIGLATYRVRGLRSEPEEHELGHVTLHMPRGVRGASVRRGIERGAAAVDAVWLARDLINEAPGRKRPPDLADHVRDLLDGSDVGVTVLDEDDLEAGGYGGLLGVGSGSSVPPRLVELTYTPRRAKGHVALVGKGITFDSGGLSLKSSKGMMTMKYDMAGAATVLAAVRAAAALGVGVRVTGLLALAENMPSGSATRPGDVLRIRGGKTVEVLNTDAEGRLVLADALVHATEAEPDAIVDVATLTGAVRVALGGKIGGLMATDDALADALLAAAGRAGERLWRLPLAADLYGEDLAGDIADVKNAGWSDAGAVRAGLFLHEFVGEGIPWAHLDIAGIGWSDADGGYLRKGATGIPVRTLVEWLVDRA